MIRVIKNDKRVIIEELRVDECFLLLGNQNSNCDTVRFIINWTQPLSYTYNYNFSFQEGYTAVGGARLQPISF